MSNFCRDAVSDTIVILPLPPSSYIPNRAVKGRAKTTSAGPIHNVLTFLELYKSFVITSAIWPYLNPFAHATEAVLASSADFPVEFGSGMSPKSLLGSMKICWMNPSSKRFWI